MAYVISSAENKSFAIIFPRIYRSLYPCAYWVPSTQRKINNDMGNYIYCKRNIQLHLWNWFYCDYSRGMNDKKITDMVLQPTSYWIANEEILEKHFVLIRVKF